MPAPIIPPVIAPSSPMTIAPYAPPDALDDWCEVVPDAERVRLLQEATDILFGLTGRSVTGQVSATVRPKRTDCSLGSVHGFWGRLDPFSAGRSIRGGMWDTRTPTMIRLARGQSSLSVTGVKIDGVAFHAYALLDGTWLVRTDGASWPADQNLYLPDTAPNTFAVTYGWGEAIPDLLRQATVELAQELWMQRIKRGRLGANATSALSQGISVSFDPKKPRDTSLPTVQAVIQTLNPQARVMPPQWSHFDDPWTLHTVV